MSEQSNKPNILNIMDSSLVDLEAKGVLASVSRTYNPDRAWSKVLHFSPHERDLKLADHLRPFEIELHIHCALNLSPLKILAAIFQMMRAIKQERVSLVRGRLPYLGSLMGVIAARLKGIPFVVSLGGDNRIVQERNDSYYFNSRWFSWNIEKLVLKLATAVIVPNDFTRRYVEGIIGEKGGVKCACIPWISDAVSSVDPVPFDPTSLGLSDKRPLVIIVGFLNSYKYTDVLYDVLEQYLESSLDDPSKIPQFVFCGDGPLREEGERRFQACPDFVHFLGWTEREVVQALMRRSAIVLIPMSGFVLLEAASLGKPVITSNVEWHAEMVVDGKTGVIVDPEKVDDWLGALQFLLSHPDECAAMGRELEALYRAKYSAEKAIEAEKTLYLRLIEAHQT